MFWEQARRLVGPMQAFLDETEVENRWAMDRDETVQFLI
jgi:hypothetical protein